MERRAEIQKLYCGDENVSSPDDVYAYFEQMIFRCWSPWHFNSKYNM